MFGVALSATPTFLFTSLRAILHFATIISHKGAEMPPQHHYHTKPAARTHSTVLTQCMAAHTHSTVLTQSMAAHTHSTIISHKAGGTQSRLTPVLLVD